MIDFGFTGSREGMTSAQRNTLQSLWTGRVGVTLHHGDCVGSDAEAHDLARYLGFRVHIHPPTNDSKRAFKVADMVADRKDYLVRNRDIVDHSDELYATPSTAKGRPRSGTWYTIRYARKLEKTVYVILPNGQILVK